MSDTLLTLHKHRIDYSPPLQPSLKDNYKYVIIDSHLQKSNFGFYSSTIKKLIKANSLRVCKENSD